jgi:hypothetical protein
MTFAARQHFAATPANDNRTPTVRALKTLGEAAVERVLGAAGAVRFALLLAGI